MGISSFFKKDKRTEKAHYYSKNNSLNKRWFNHMYAGVRSGIQKYSEFSTDRI